MHEIKTALGGKKLTAEGNLQQEDVTGIARKFKRSPMKEHGLRKRKLNDVGPQKFESPL